MGAGLGSQKVGHLLPWWESRRLSHMGEALGMGGKGMGCVSCAYISPCVHTLTCIHVDMSTCASPPSVCLHLYTPGGNTLMCAHAFGETGTGRGMEGCLSLIPQCRSGVFPGSPSPEEIGLP